MGRYIRRPVTETVAGWQIGSDPRPDWVPDYNDGWLREQRNQWLVEDDEGEIKIYPDDKFRRLYQSTDPIPDDDYNSIQDLRSSTR